MKIDEEAGLLREKIQTANREIAKHLHKLRLKDPVATASLNKALKELGFKSYSEYDEKELFPELKNPDNAG